MNCITIGRDGPNAGVFSHRPIDRLPLRPTLRHGEVDAVAALVRAVAGAGQPLRDKGRLMLFGAIAAGGREARRLEIRQGVKARRESCW